jgi:hypothetical protein
MQKTKPLHIPLTAKELKAQAVIQERKAIRAKLQKRARDLWRGRFKDSICPITNVAAVMEKALTAAGIPKDEHFIVVSAMAPPENPPPAMQVAKKVQKPVKPAKVAKTAKATAPKRPAPKAVTKAVKAPRVPAPSLLRTQNDHASFIKSELVSKRIDRLQMASFGLWAGVLSDVKDWNKETNPTASIFTTCTNLGVPTEVLIGVAPFYSKAGKDLPPCSFCAAAHRKMFVRLEACRKTWPAIDWTYHPASHTKLALGWKGKKLIWAILGGHNLTDNKLKDLSIVLSGPQTEPLKGVFDELKASSKESLRELKNRFEYEVKDAAEPTRCRPEFSEDAGVVGKGPERTPATPAELPKAPEWRAVPPAEDLILLLNALAGQLWLDIEEFRRVSRSSAWLINQHKKEFSVAGKSTRLASDPAVLKAMQDYQTKRASAVRPQTWRPGPNQRPNYAAHGG